MYTAEPELLLGIWHQVTGDSGITGSGSFFSLKKPKHTCWHVQYKHTHLLMVTHWIFLSGYCQVQQTDHEVAELQNPIICNYPVCLIPKKRALSDQGRRGKLKKNGIHSFWLWYPLWRGSLCVVQVCGLCLHESTWRVAMWNEGFWQCFSQVENSLVAVGGYDSSVRWTVINKSYKGWWRTNKQVLQMNIVKKQLFTCFIIY